MDWGGKAKFWLGYQSNWSQFTPPGDAGVAIRPARWLALHGRMPSGVGVGPAASNGYPSMCCGNNLNDDIKKMHADFRGIM